MSRRALLVATDSYADPTFRGLGAPARDARELEAVLRDAEIADFEVEVLLNESSAVVGRSIGKFYKDSGPHDLVLLYFTGHGVKDDYGDLYLATHDSEHDDLNFSAISAQQINRSMNQFRSHQKVLILDCCYGGAFPTGTKGDTNIGAIEEFKGKGRTVLTASDAAQYSFEQSFGDEIGHQSIFTRFLVEGLRTGAADLNNTGSISIRNAYDYVHKNVTQERPHQRPKIQEDVEGTIVIASNNSWQPAEWLVDALGSAVVDSRLSAVGELSRLAKTGSERARGAYRDLLYQLCDDDSRKVSASAAEAVEKLYGPPVVAKPPVDTKPPVVAKPPVDTKPPVVAKPPVDTKPPVVAKPPDGSKNSSDSRITTLCGLACAAYALFCIASSVLYWTVSLALDVICVMLGVSVLLIAATDLVKKGARDSILLIFATTPAVLTIFTQPSPGGVADVEGLSVAAALPSGEYVTALIVRTFICTIGACVLLSLSIATSTSPSYSRSTRVFVSSAAASLVLYGAGWAGFGAVLHERLIVLALIAYWFSGLAASKMAIDSLAKR